ncbi:MAG: hypothetical protein QW491_10905 [Thermoproteota archaeon]|nr:hypothetical protein [Candidatus Brockarchaeota archaeon]
MTHDYSKDAKTLSLCMFHILAGTLMPDEGEAVKRESFSYKDLARISRKAQRNGNWRRLTLAERALFRACMELAKLRGILVNHALVERLKHIVLKLLQTTTVRLLQLGREYGKYLLELYKKNGVVELFPKIRDLLNDPKYLLWLGVKQTVLRSTGWS